MISSARDIDIRKLYEAIVNFEESEESQEFHDAAVNDGETLVLGEADPLHMTAQERKEQQVVSITLPSGG